MFLLLQITMQNKLSSSSAEEIASSIDIVWEILLRLPLISLLQLKCVSKQWLTLISDQKFRESHSLHRHQHYPTSLIFSECGQSHFLSFTATAQTLRVFNLDFLNESKVTVIRSCNGLLLCRSTSAYVISCTPKWSNASAYFICNPITGDFTTFNLLSHPCWNKKIELYLVFDPSISPHCKVISVAPSEELDSQFDWVFNVYSFKTSSWIRPGVFLSTPFELDAANGIYCNRGIHWCCTAEFSVYFDVDTQCVKNYPMPLSDLEWERRSIACFGESGGRLHLMLTISMQTHKYDIFEMKEDYSGWSLRHCVDLNQVELPLTWNFFYIVRKAKEDKSVSQLMHQN